MAHNEHLREPALDRVRKVANGICYQGIGATLNPDYILIASDMSSLRDLWARLTDIPLNEEKCYQLAVFQQADTKEESE